MTPAFESALHDQITSLREQQLNESDLKRALDVLPENDRIQFDHRGEGILARTSTAAISQWSSNAAIIADVAAATELQSRYPDWNALAPAEIARVLLSLRVFLEECPSCGGPVQIEQEVVESCCRSHDVIASVCQSCETRLFEMEWNDPENSLGPEQPHSEQAPV